MWLFAIWEGSVMTLCNKTRKNFQAAPKKSRIWPWPISDASDKNVRDAMVCISGINSLIIQNKPNVAATVGEWILTMCCENNKHKWSQLLPPWVMYEVGGGQQSPAPSKLSTSYTDRAFCLRTAAGTDIPVTPCNTPLSSGGLGLGSEKGFSFA